ncbi:MAG: hypothetical protein MJ105_00920 [Lachnospiraceae bacterium]|nr:hypothetical protein [Lachnospiraceae bacterium]
MKGEIAFNANKLDELADAYARERDVATDIVNVLKKSLRLSNSGLEQEYRSLIREADRISDTLNNLSRATRKIFEEVEEAQAKISRDIVSRREHADALGENFWNAIAQR